MNQSVDLSNTTLETTRLLLRSFQDDDLADFNRYAAVPGVGERAGWQAHQSMAESRAILLHFQEGKHTFAIVLKATGQVIGSLGIEPLNPDVPVASASNGRMLGYVLAKPEWGRGLMSEAVDAVVTYCFKTLAFDHLQIAFFNTNAASRRVAEKCGFAPYAELTLTTQWGEPRESQVWLLRNPRSV